MSPVATDAMKPVMVRTDCNGFRPTFAFCPAASATTMVSPMALANPSMSEAAIPLEAAGTTTLIDVSHFVAPMARLASLICLGTAFMASSEMLTTMGSTMNVITTIALTALK